MRKTSGVVALLGAGLFVATAPPARAAVEDTNSKGYAAVENRVWGLDSWAAIDRDTGAWRLDEHF